MAPLDDDLRSGHLTPADGKVFADLGFAAEEAAALLAEADARMGRVLDESALDLALSATPAKLSKKA